MKQRILLSILALSIITSCTVQKRHYRKGYEVTFGKSKINQPKKTVLENNNSEVAKFEESEMAIQNNQTALTASTENKAETKTLAKKHNVFNLSRKVNNDDTCDMVFLRNGNTINAKILEINTTEVKYKNCNNQDGPLIIIDKNSIKSITYKNGFTEEFAFVTPPNTSKPQPNSNPNTNPNRRQSSSDYDGYSIASLICGILSIFLIPALPALILGIIGMKKTKENGTLGYGMAVAGTVLGALVIGLFLLLIIVALAAI